MGSRSARPFPFVMSPADAGSRKNARLVAAGADGAWLGAHVRTMLAEGHPRVAGDPKPLEIPNLASLPPADQILWPCEYRGLLAVVRHGPPRELVAVMPFCDDGVQMTLKVEEVAVASNGVEALVTVDAGAVPLTFYDTRFCLNRSSYQGTRKRKVMIAAMAYECAPTLREEPVDIVDPLGTTVHVNPAGINMFMSSGEHEEEVFLQGPVREVWEVDFLEGKAFWLTVTVLDDGDDQAFDLPILVPHAAWACDRPPQLEYVRASVWLQGYLA